MRRAGESQPWDGVSRWLSRVPRQWRPTETIIGNVALTLAAFTCPSPPLHILFLVPNHLSSHQHKLQQLLAWLSEPKCVCSCLSDPLSPTSRLPQTWRTFLLSAIVEITELGKILRLSRVLKMPEYLIPCQAPREMLPDTEKGNHISRKSTTFPLGHKRSLHF